jgi:hypothetical protein
MTDRAGQHGSVVEEDVRVIAARLGLADFVYRAELVARGGGNREPGDALVYANGLGAIVQVKSRDPDAASADTSNRVQAWIDKHGTKAAQQAAGTRRELIRRRDAGQPVLAVPVRVQHLPLDEQRAAGLLLDMEIDSWPTIVVLDHPLAANCRSPLPANVFWITLGDWHALHQAIRSTTGVLTYVHRVLAADPVSQWTLGTEELRYAVFANADMAAAASEGGSAGYFDRSVLDEPIFVEVYRDVMRRLWPEDGRLPSVPIDKYRLILEHLDGVAPGQAAALGRWIQRKREHLRNERSWASGVSIGDGRLLVYACDHAENYENAERFDAELVALVATRCTEFRDAGHLVEQGCGVGVLQSDGWLDYRYVFMKPPVEIPLELRFEVQQQRGKFDADSCRVVDIERVGRNERCPCGSGLKFKRCHGG